MAKKTSEKKSNRTLIRETIDAKGEEAARKLGAKLKMKSGTVDAYIKGWARIKSGNDPTKIVAAKAPTPVKKIATTPKKEEPCYRFANEAKAQAWVASRPKESGLKPECFSLKKQPGALRFAVIVNKDYIAKSGAFTKPALRALESQGFAVEDGMIRQVKKRKAA
jgi:hypothetical protein